MFTRKDMIAAENEEEAHKKYYREILASSPGIILNPNFVKECALLIKNGDVYLNNIPWLRWEAMTSGIMKNALINKAFLDRGDKLTPNGARCVVTELVNYYIEKNIVQASSNSVKENSE